MVRIFIAYSSKDLVFKEEIRKRLRPLQRAGKVKIWDNYDIEVGRDWDAEVKEKLAKSDLILLLLSPDALDSEYFYEVEAPIALARHKAGEAIAVGVLLRPCSFRHTPFEFEKYELLPKKGYPIVHSHWHNADEAYLTIFQEVDILVDRIVEKRIENKKVQTPPYQEIVEKSILDIQKSKVTEQFKNGQVIRDIPEGPKMVFVEGATFQMGSNEIERESFRLVAIPVHLVSVPSFCIGQYSVTFEEYDTFCKEKWKSQVDDNGWGRAHRPVVNVNCNEAEQYCQWLSEKIGKKYRLPSEAEWEFAVRGGKLSADQHSIFFKKNKFAGSNSLKEVGWFIENSEDKTHPVGMKKSNVLGIYDMCGNVLEWCADYPYDNYQGAPDDGSAWLKKDSNALHIVRGGAYNFGSKYCHVAHRSPNGTGNYQRWIGFRVARDL